MSKHRKPQDVDNVSLHQRIDRGMVLQGYVLRAVAWGSEVGVDAVRQRLADAAREAGYPFSLLTIEEVGRQLAALERLKLVKRSIADEETQATARGGSRRTRGVDERLRYTITTAGQRAIVVEDKLLAKLREGRESDGSSEQ